MSRGFRAYTSFKFRNYGHEELQTFSVQESSLAEEEKVWVGFGEHRAHLTKGEVRKVRDALTEFLGQSQNKDGSFEDMFSGLFRGMNK